MKRSPLLCLALALGACQPLPAGSTAVQRGSALAQASCSSCHGVARYATSPNPDAPPFSAIANQEGLTADTLGPWLRDAHNYPREMQFELDPRDVDALVAYMISLRDPDYRPTG